jgi:hypothetical protein
MKRHDFYEHPGKKVRVGYKYRIGMSRLIWD